MTDSRRIAGYDLVRTLAIVGVYLGHLIHKSTDYPALRVTFDWISPGVAMSLLAFVSSALLVGVLERSDVGEFYIRRFTRIYCTLWLCLIPLTLVLGLTGWDVVHEHSIWHYLGLTLCFYIPMAPNHSPLGLGLWFVTAILALYLLLPLIVKLFRHRNHFWHLIGLLLACLILEKVVTTPKSLGNVTGSFLLGAYLALHGHLPRLERPQWRLLLPAVGLLTLVGLLATAEVIPRDLALVLYPLYPLVLVPILFAVAARLPDAVMRPISFFSFISYEFYILHFYFVGHYWDTMFPGANSLWLEIVCGFVLTLLCATPVAYLARSVRRRLDAYLIEKDAVK